MTMRQNKISPRKMVMSWVAVSLFAAQVMAQDTVSAAKDEDLQAFDTILSQQRSAAPAKAPGSASAFGDKIADRAKELGNRAKRDAFKQYVSDALEEKRAGSSGAQGSSASDHGSNSHGIGNGAAANSNANRPKKPKGRP